MIEFDTLPIIVIDDDDDILYHSVRLSYLIWRGMWRIYVLRINYGRSIKRTRLAAFGEADHAHVCRSRTDTILACLRFTSGTCIAGAACSGSVKQIMHMSSASWRSGAAPSAPPQPYRHGRHVRSPRTPPHKWPHDNTRLHASRPYSYGNKRTT